MGFSFTNLQIRHTPAMDAASLDKLADRIAAEYALKPVTAPEEADVVTAIYHPEGAEWVTVVSDVFDADMEKQTALAKMFSKEYDAPVLAISCFDSDYLTLNWLDGNRGQDFFAANGSAAGMGLTGMRRSSPAAWKALLPDGEAFKAVMRQKYVCAEDAVAELAEMLQLPVEQGQACIDMLAELPETKLYYYAAAQENAEPPRFVKDSPFADSWDMLQWNGDNLASFYNAGGDTRGVTLLLAGDDLTSGALKLTGAKFGFINRQGASEHIPIQFERVMFPDGVVRFRADMPEHRVRGVPAGLPPKKHQMTAFERGFFLIFTLQPRDAERTAYAPVFAYAIPSKNWAGQGVEVFRQ